MPPPHTGSALTVMLGEDQFHIISPAFSDFWAVCKHFHAVPYFIIAGRYQLCTVLYFHYADAAGADISLISFRKHRVGIRIPAWDAASRMVVPSFTSTLFPLIFSFYHFFDPASFQYSKSEVVARILFWLLTGFFTGHSFFDQFKVLDPL